MDHQHHNIHFAVIFCHCLSTVWSCCKTHVNFDENTHNRPPTAHPQGWNIWHNNCIQQEFVHCFYIWWQFCQNQILKWKFTSDLSAISHHSKVRSIITWSNVSSYEGQDDRPKMHINHTQNSENLIQSSAIVAQYNITWYYVEDLRKKERKKHYFVSWHCTVFHHSRSALVYQGYPAKRALSAMRNHGW